MSLYALILMALPSAISSRRASTPDTSLLLSTNQPIHDPVHRSVLPLTLALSGGASRSSLSKKRKGKASKRRPGSQTNSLSKARAASSSSASKTITGKPSLQSAKSKGKTAASDAFQKFGKILPATRFYLASCIALTVLSVLLGEELTQGLFSYTPAQAVFGGQVWRFFTAACFLGAPSISSLMSAYYLYEYGSKLEKAYGTAQFLTFVISQIVILSFLAGVFMTPFYAQPILTAMLHVLSRQLPFENVKWLIFTVPYWTLPYGLMISDCLQAQSASAALPHILGIITGHFYHFHKNIWPAQGGDDWLIAPDWLKRRLDEDGIDKEEGMDEFEKAKARMKKRRGKGIKLGD